MKFGKLILRKVIKIFATRCLILDPLAGFGGPTSKGRGKGSGAEGREREGRKREGWRKGKGEDDCYSKLF